MQNFSRVTQHSPSSNSHRKIFAPPPGLELFVGAKRDYSGGDAHLESVPMYLYTGDRDGNPKNFSFGRALFPSTKRNRNESFEGPRICHVNNKIGTFFDTMGEELLLLRKLIFRD